MQLWRCQSRMILLSRNRFSESTSRNSDYLYLFYFSINDGQRGWSQKLLEGESRSLMSKFLFLCSSRVHLCRGTGKWVQTRWFRVQLAGSSPAYKLTAAVWRVTQFNLLCRSSFASWQATGCCYQLPSIVLLSRRKATVLNLPVSNTRKIRDMSQIPHFWRWGKHKMVITNYFLHHIFLKLLCFIHVRVFSFALQPWGWNNTFSFCQMRPEICSLFTQSPEAAFQT